MLYKDKNNLNKVKIAKFILHQGETSKPEIASSLGISMPTVLQNVRELIDDKIVTEIGSYQSTGGRKAKVLSIVDNVRYAVGIDITQNHISLILLNLKGNPVKSNRIRQKFDNSLDYYEFINYELKQFIAEAEINREKILGVGIALPGIIDKSNELLVKSHILKLSNVSLKNISQMIEYDVRFENDANSAAMAELNWVNKNAVYLSLSNTVGGAIYINRSIYLGDNYRSAEFGHIMIETNGRQCYCGKKGCVDAYCSARILSESSNDNLTEFFHKIDMNDENAMKLWECYLEYLAITVANLRMAFDSDIILGGYVGGYLGKYMPELNRKVIKYNLFENDTTYLKLCKYQHESSAIGIAMSFIERYFETMV
ncbi:MAG: ROK family protein [Herbinix sp.]|nr:ROK family protein [Herbinix sp.]